MKKISVEYLDHAEGIARRNVLKEIEVLIRDLPTIRLNRVGIFVRRYPILKKMKELKKG